MPTFFVFFTEEIYLRINLRMLLTNLYPMTIPSTKDIAFPFRRGVVMSERGDNDFFFSEIDVDSLVKGNNRLVETVICSCCLSISFRSCFLTFDKS